MAAEPPDAGEDATARRDGASDRAGETAESRSVVAGALRYAIVDAEAWTLRTYAVVATLAATFVGLLVLLAFPLWVTLTDANPLQRVGRAFLVLVGLALLASIVLPVVLVHRRHRAGRPERQVALGLAGYVYLASLYLGAVTAAPPEGRSEPPVVVAPVVDALYAMPPVAGVAFVLAGVAAVLATEYDLLLSG